MHSTRRASVCACISAYVCIGMLAIAEEERAKAAKVAALTHHHHHPNEASDPSFCDCTGRLNVPCVCV